MDMLLTSGPQDGTKRRPGRLFTVSHAAYLHLRHSVHPQNFQRCTEGVLTFAISRPHTGGMGILCSCLPVCWPLVVRSVYMIYTPSTWSWKGSSGSTRRGGSWWRHKPFHSWDSATTRNTAGPNTDARVPVDAHGMGASDVELPILAPLTEPGAGDSTGSQQQSWIWSQARRSSGGDDLDEQPGHLHVILVDRSFSRVSDSATEDPPGNWS